MDKRRVLVADTGEEYRREFVKEIHEEPDIQVMGQTGNGFELIDLIQHQEPDVVVMEMILAGIDGVEVLERLASLPLERKPRVLVVTSLTTGNMADLAVSRGANHYMTKPCRPATVCERILQLCNAGCPEEEPKQPKQDLESIVTNILLEIGVPPHISGYSYLREAIILTVNDGEIMRAVTKVLYPTVAKRCHSTAQRVERSIRHAIKTVWEHGDPAALQKYFGQPGSCQRKKPTNSEFIARIADRLQLRLRINI